MEELRVFWNEKDAISYEGPHDKGLATFEIKNRLYGDSIGRPSELCRNNCHKVQFAYPEFSIVMTNSFAMPSTAFSHGAAVRGAEAKLPGESWRTWSSKIAVKGQGYIVAGP